ncbi:MAG TPA: AmmeMemoRadiSam system protein B, partial [Anaerolineales bacterium]|nr:AmmeMemoRadiSam system protein B [Anaerolineales bacterium]
SPIAGRWYPDDPQELTESVDFYINQARLPQIHGEVIAIIAPHAGHRYSGPVAGYAFAAVRSLKPEVVAVVSPMHYPYAEAVLTSAHTAYSTPLGEIALDQKALHDLDTSFTLANAEPIERVGRDPEHSLEIELPFLQRALSEKFTLLPLMVRELNPQPLEILGKHLAHALHNRPALLVASTDLSHFYPQAAAEKLDREMLRRIETFDPQAVLRAEDEGAGFACGRGAVAVVLWAARELGANHVQILHYATSGDVTGDFHQVVGYGAVLITRQ